MPLETENITPRLSQLLEVVIDARLRELHFALPGQVTEYNSVTNQVSVRPQIKRKYKGADTAHDLPIVNNVPVVFPRTANAHLSLPLAVGDFGQIVFNERSLDLWQERGRAVDPEDPRKLDLNDAVFLPGLYPQTQMIMRSGEANSLEIRNNTAHVEITDGGKYKIQNETAELFTELVNLMDQLVSGFNELATNHKTNTMLGPQQPLNFSQYDTIKTMLESIKTKLEGLKA